MTIFIAIAFLLLAVIAAFFHLLFHQVEGRYFDSGGIRIHYTDEGAGAPVILIHGFAVNATLNWRRPGFIRALRRRFRVVAMDVRGHGLSDKPHEAGAYGERMLDDIARLMDHLGLPKAHIAGYSMGGFLTLAFLDKYPGRVITAMIGGAGWYPPDRYPDLLETVPRALDEGRGFDPILRFFEPETSSFRELRIAIPNFVLSRLNDLPAMARSFGSLRELAGSEERLRANAVPILSVMGTNDPLRQALDNMIGKTANHEVFWLEGANHLTAMASPRHGRMFLDRFVRFLSSHSGTLCDAAAG